MAALALILGMGLVWVFGVAIVQAVGRNDRDVEVPGEIPWELGCGWFVGLFLLTLWMRALSAVGVAFGIASIAIPLVAFTAIAGWLAWRGRQPWTRWPSTLRALLAPDLAGWQRAAWLAILGWMALRFFLLLTEVVRRPLFPWDAWTQWSTKARVWYELRRMAPFVTPSEWFAAASPSVFVDAAPHYPGTVPLFQVWAATLIGRWDDTLVNLPWWVTGVAFGCAIYGYLVRERFSPLAALVGTWLVLSLPILDTHIALAGYADLAMATYLTLAALSALLWVRTRAAAHAVLALLLAVACLVIKNPGKVWVATMIPGLVAASVPRHGRRIAGAAIGLALVAVLVLARIDTSILGYQLHLEFDMPWGGLYDAYLALGNWHLLWYGAVAIALIAWRDLFAPDTEPYTWMVLAGILFLLFGFAFTNARLWVEDQSTVNRATLHVAPLVVIWMLMAFRAWATRVSRRTAETPPTTAPSPQA